VVTPARLWWLVSGELYQSYYLGTSFTTFRESLGAGAGLLLQQFGLAGLLLGLLGLIVFGVRSRLAFLTVWTAAVSLLFAMFYSSADSYVYLIPMFISFAIWIGSGISGLLRNLPGRFSMVGFSLGLLVIGFFISRAWTSVRLVDASRDLRAESFGREVLAAVPDDAVLFAEGDEAIFTLWYYHFALGRRPDVAVLATDLLHFDWYQENLRLTYPWLVVPAPFAWPETIAAANPSRQICYVRYAEGADIDCSQPVTVP